MRFRVVVAIATVIGVFGVSLAARAASVDEAASVHQPARRVEVPSGAANPADERPGRDMLAIINVARLERGRSILVWDDAVAAAATAHSIDMAGQRRLDHIGSDGSTAADRLTRAGVVWSTWGENIGAGFNDPQVLFEAWSESASHARHLFGDFTHVGIGVASSPDGVAYWTLDFTG